MSDDKKDDLTNDKKPGKLKKNLDLEKKLGSLFEQRVTPKNDTPKKESKWTISTDTAPNIPLPPPLVNMSIPPPPPLMNMSIPQPSPFSSSIPSPPSAPFTNLHISQSHQMYSMSPPLTPKVSSTEKLLTDSLEAIKNLSNVVASNNANSPTFGNISSPRNRLELSSRRRSTNFRNSSISLALETSTISESSQSSNSAFKFCDNDLQDSLIQSNNSGLEERRVNANRRRNTFDSINEDSYMKMIDNKYKKLNK